MDTYTATGVTLGAHKFGDTGRVVIFFTRERGNDLTTPQPMYMFPGLRPGDRWCLCASRWLEAYRAGCAPPVVLGATHAKALEIVPIEALTAQIESEPFLIDNTPPVIAGLSGRRSGGKLVVEWKAADALNIIEKAEYSLNGGPWLPVPPVSKLSDWRELEYSLTLDGAPGEQVVAVRVTDWYGNQRVGQTVVK